MTMATNDQPVNNCERLPAVQPLMTKSQATANSAKPYVALGEICVSQWYDMKGFCMPCCAPSGSKSSAMAAAKPDQAPHSDPKKAYAPRPVKRTPTGASTPANAAYEWMPEACLMNAGSRYIP